MRLFVVITDYEKKVARHTTIRLAREATLRGHEVWLCQPGDFTLGADDRLWVEVRGVQRQHYKSSAVYLKELLETPKLERLRLEAEDLVLLRDNPAKYGRDRTWAPTAGVTFGRLAKECGVLVLNDPDGLAKATSKIYLQGFPSEVRPRTIVTRSLSEVRRFAEESHQDLILKPVQGSGGERVFIVKKGSAYNLNQLVESLSAEGYLIAQEYLPEAQAGDVRLFLMDGEPLMAKGRYAAFRRRNASDDIRSNMHAGGRIEAAEVTEEMLGVVAQVKDKLVRDGMFLVGLDLVGPKLMEINVFCPGGLEGMEKLYGVNLTGKVIAALEKRLAQHLSRDT